MRSLGILLLLLISMTSFSQTKLKKNRHRPESSFDALSQSRNFFLPTGLIPKEAYYRGYYVYLNEVNFKLDKNIYGGIGLTPIGGLVTYPHLGYSREIRKNVRVGGGTYLFHSPGIDFNNKFTGVMPYLTLTEGTTNRYIHFFYSKFYLFNGDLDNAPTDIIGAGFSWRFKPKWRLFAEVIYVNADFEKEDFILLNNMGVSWFYRSHKLDFGISPVIGPFNIFFTNRNQTTFFPLPLFSYSLIF